MKRSKKQNWNQKLLTGMMVLAIFAGTGALTGCAKPKTTTQLAAHSDWDSSNPNPMPTPSSTGGTGSGGGSNSGGSSPPPADPNLLPPITESFTVTGSAGTAPAYTTASVDTDNILRVKITAGPASTITVDNSNFSAVYSCVSYTITALGQTVTTAPLKVEGNAGLAGQINCPNAATSQTIDFSGRLTPGHGPITITVKASGYDFYCQGCQTQPWLYGAYPYGPYSCSLYCPLHTVFKTHTVTGTLSIQVNGTNI